MSTTLSSTKLGALLGVAGTGAFFANYGSARVLAMLDSHHGLNPGYMGKDRFYGNVGSHNRVAKLSANHLGSNYGGLGAVRLPQSGERILLDVLPSCSDITGVSVIKSVAGALNRFASEDDGTEGAFVTDHTTDPVTTAPKSINEAVMPQASATGIWPAMDIWAGLVSGGSADPADPTKFPKVLIKADADGAMRPEAAFIDTGGADEQWLVWAVLAGAVPANSFAQVEVRMNAGARD